MYNSSALLFSNLFDFLVECHTKVEIEIRARRSSLKASVP